MPPTRTPTGWKGQKAVQVARPVSDGEHSNDLQVLWEFGQKRPWDEDIQDQSQDAATLLHIDRYQELYPDWKKQVLRCAVPCINISKFHWRRVCHCISLGRLFGLLGQEFTADVLYHFYRTRRIVVSKAPKGK